MDTLDVLEPQILVHLPSDRANLFWHQRLLLKKIGGGRLVCATPDLELCVHNLSEERHLVLDRCAMYPEQHRDSIYGFDVDLTRAQIASLKRRAATQAAILDDKDTE